MSKNKALLHPRFGRLAAIWPQLLLAFCFPMLTVLAALVITGCYPFGDRTMLTVDLYHQYAPFVVTFRNKVLSGQSILYSWNDGLGQEFYAAYANYAASPLNLFALFFTAKTIPVYIGFVTCLRAGLSGLFMMFFLSENDNNRVDNITVVFACTYALCGWYIAYFWNIMWCDAVVFLPLVMLGLRKLLIERKCAFYAATLAILIFSNYYAGFFVCLFLVMFAPAYYVMLFTPGKPKGDPMRLCFKTFVGAALRFAFSSIVAAGATAVLTVPTYLILRHCSATGDTLPKDFTLQNNLFDFLGRLMVAANPNIRDGMANVYSGVVAVILLPLFFMLPKRTGITLRHKISFGILIFVMYLSFTNRTLNFIWHGLHFPNQIPYRESFLMSFLLVFIAFLTIRRIRSLHLGYVMGSVAAWFGFLVLYEKFGKGNESYIQIGCTLLFIIVQGAALRVVSDAKNGRSSFYCETLLTVTMLVEIFASATISIGLVAEHEGFSSYAPYGRNQPQITEYVNSVEGTEGHKNFERSELFPNNICDIQALYDVKGISIFSSTARESFVKYMRNFGFHNNGINGFRNAGITRVTATLLGVRNLIETEKTKTVPALFEKEYTSGPVTSWGNPDALSVGYMVSEKFPEYVPEYLDQGNVFSKTNKWINAMGVDGDVYKTVNLTPVESVGMSTKYSKNTLILYTIEADDDDECGFTVTVDDAKIGADIYVYAGSSKGGNATITVGETSKTFEIRSFQIISLGVYDGTPITLKVSYYDPPTATPIYVYGYQLDVPAYKNMVEKLSDEQLEVTSYDSTSLNGTITAKESGLLFLTIPYSEGWYAWVDGEKAEVIPVNDALMAIKLNAGKHDIRIEYIPDGFKPGVAITCASIVVIILLAAIPALANKIRASKKAAVPAAAAPVVPAEPSQAETPASVTPAEAEVPAGQDVQEEAETAEPSGETETEKTVNASSDEESAEPLSGNGDVEQ
ncbi:MAG: YfhO family protein [Saccharofermentans sp.]|nr:YfhO family protein [Saccharofermentans sp.]